MEIGERVFLRIACTFQRRIRVGFDGAGSFDSYTHSPYAPTPIFVRRSSVIRSSRTHLIRLGR